MRDDIFLVDKFGNPLTDENGNKLISIPFLIGKNYGNGWFSNCDARYRFYKGGRGTKKSQNMMGYEPIIKILSCPQRNVLICRQNDVDNRQSTFEKIVKCIGDLGLSSSFEILKNPLQITYKYTGQKIIFRGLNNPTSLNGIDFSTGFFTDAYIDEAYEVPSFEDFRKLDGSMRGVLPKGLFYQITCCFNAWSEDTWLFSEFFQHRLDDNYDLLDDENTKYLDYYDKDFIGPFGKGLYLHISTYKANEFRDKENYDVSALEMKKRAPEIYKVEFLGMWGNSTEVVYPEFNDSLIFSPQHFFSEDSSKNINRMEFADYSIGIDTGLSNGQGGKRTVKKGENVATRIKSATTMQLCAITKDLSKMVVLDEYFHSNNKAYNYVNTDNKDEMTEPQLVMKCIDTIIQWRNKYGQDNSGTILMKGTINVYVDSADLGFRQALELEANRQGLYNVRFFQSTKLSVQSRVDFERLMMAYGDFEISTMCKNLIREMKNARRGEKGEAREDNDDHALTAMEYGFAPLLPSLRRFKSFKLR